MKTKRLLILILSFVMLLASVAVIASANTSEGGSKAAQGIADYTKYEFPANQPASSYPIAVFEEHSDGTYTLIDLYAGADWNVAINKAVELSKVSSKDLPKFVVYLRGDVTPKNENDVFLTGHTTITVDLNNHTINKANIPYLMHVLAQSDRHEIDVNVTFKNGTLLNSCTVNHDKSWRAFFQFAADEHHHTQDTYADFTFENVKFVDKRTEVTASGLIYSMGGSNSTKENFVNVTLNNCELYPQQKTNAVFHSLDNNNGTHVTLTMNGGKIVFPSAEIADKFVTLDLDGDSVAFGKYNGSYTEFVFPNSSVPSKAIIVKNNEGKELMLSNPTADGDNTVYTPAAFTDEEGVADGIETTPYATITGLSAEQTAEAYPLAVFEKQGNWYKLKGLYTDWYTAASAATFDGAVIYFRESVVCAVPEKAETSAGAGLAGCTARITVDLNEKSITATQRYLYDLVFGATATNVFVNIKNGEMIQSDKDASGKEVPEDARWRSFIFYNYNEKHSTEGSRVDFTFDNVTFRDNRATSSIKTPYFTVLTHKNGSIPDIAYPEIKGDIVYNNCTFYPNQAALFNAHEDTDFVNLNITVNGGKVIADKYIPMSKLYTMDEGYDTVTFGKYDGKYTEFFYPTSVEVSITNDIAVADETGMLRMLYFDRSENGNNVYSLVERTPYGPIVYSTDGYTSSYGDAYKNVTNYPLTVFGSEGKLLGLYAGSDWQDAVYEALKNPKAFIFLRADATPNDDPVYISDHTATLLVDLNGKTLTKKNQAYFLIVLPAGADGKPKTDLDVTFINGTLINNTPKKDIEDKSWRGFFQLTADKRHTIEDAYADFTFDNVKFVDNRTKTSGLHFIFSMAGADATKKSTSTVVFNNCEMFPSAGVSNVFDFKDNVNINVDVTMNGGKIVSQNDLTDFESLFKANTSGDKFAFGKYGDKYTTVELPDGKWIDCATVWNTADGAECVFVRSGNVFTLCPTVLVGYKLTTNVTMHTNLTYNIYIPKAGLNDASGATSISVTFNGKKYALTDYNDNYYSVVIEIPSSQIFKDIAVEVTLKTGTTTVKASWNLSMFKYSKTIIDGSYIDVSKALIKDMLLYAYQTNKFFGEDANVTAQLTEIEEILSTYYRRLPTGESKTPETGYLNRVEIYVGGNPAFRFYPEDGKDASKFAFTANGEPVTGTIDGNGYIEVRVPAYDMLDGIGITYDGTSIGYYNLFAYHDYVISLKSTYLTNRLTEYAYLLATVEGLMKYCDSAVEYVNYIVSGKPGLMSIVVPEQIYPNVPGMDVTALFTNGDYYGNVTWTTSNGNVYIENSKIYAVGIFTQKTQVTITATTEHHTATATVTVVPNNSQEYKYIQNFNHTTDTYINDTGIFVIKKQNESINYDFVVEGKLDIYRVSFSTTDNGNPHVQFRFHDDQKFLLMDQDEDGIFNVVEYGVVNHAEKYDTNSGKITLDFAVVVSEKTAYLYIDGEKVATLDVSKANYFNLGALRMDVLFYDIKLYTKSADEDAYNAAVSKYSK